jgi:hypothetical protein
LAPPLSPLSSVNSTGDKQEAGRQNLRKIDNLLTSEGGREKEPNHGPFLYNTLNTLWYQFTKKHTGSMVLLKKVLLDNSIPKPALHIKII